MKAFLRMSVRPYDLQSCAARRDVTAVTKILKDHFDEVAEGEFEWLRELLDVGCSFAEMARVLIDGEIGSPWILIDDSSELQSTPILDYHQADCAHTGGCKVDIAPQLIPLNSSIIKNSPKIELSQIREAITQTCGLCGILPLSGNTDIWRPQVSSIRFIGERNSVAWINYVARNENPTSLQNHLFHLLDIMRRILGALGYLQTVGMCCDSICVLRLEELDGPIELCRVQVRLVYDLQQALLDLTPNKLEIPLWQACSRIVDQIVESVVGGRKLSQLDKAFGAMDPLGVLNKCALASQILSLSVLSYTTAHVGPFHPEYLVDPLEELHLLGLSKDNGSAHIVAELLDFTCMKDMLEEPVLVFKWSSDDASEQRCGNRHDLLAAPEDIVDTWGPARFIADITSPKSLWAIEIGGGTISYDSSHSEKLHWNLGTAPYGNHTLSFCANDKVLIGAGTTINNRCPLDELESWRYPYNNAHLRYLGTSGERWELQQKQAGFQGGQYAVLQINATYFKQSGVTLKRRQLMRPPDQMELAFLLSNCGLQVSFCTGVARRVSLRELLADVMVAFVESRLVKPAFWDELKTHYDIVENFKNGDLQEWFNQLATPYKETIVNIVRSMLEVLKDTGIDKKGEELVIAWIRREGPYTCLRLRCEKTSLWARILADSEDCATFACITPLCLESENHKCRGLEIAPWHNGSKMLDTAVCQQLSSSDVQTTANSLAWKLQHHDSYWIGRNGSNLIARVWMQGGNEPKLIVRQKVFPERYRARLPRGISRRLGRLKERQVGDAIGEKVVILAQI